jgi:hypothetical protein
MKKVLALVVAAACALPGLARAQQADNAKMLEAFSAQARVDWGNLQVILLNDRTVEALFGTSPAKAAFRTKARMTTVFFIQGTAKKDVEFKNDVTVTQKGETLTGKVTPMKNFAGGKVAKGEQMQGLVEMEKKIDLYQPFKVTVGGDSVDFKLRDDDVRDYGNR